MLLILAADGCSHATTRTTARRRLLRMPLEIEHIIPRKHHGDDSPNNLTLACFPCNCHKGANLTGIDPESGNVTRLFHRRRDTWADHFQRQDQVIVGLSDIGRVTIDVLRLNAPEALRLREAIAE